MSILDHQAINLGIWTTTSYLSRYLSDVNRKFKELMERVNRAKSDDKHFDQLRRKITVLKKDQEVVSNKFNAFILQNAPAILSNIDINLEDLNAGFEKYKRVEDYQNSRSNELMIDVSKYKDLEEDFCAWTAVNGELLSESGRKAEEGGSVLNLLMEVFEKLKIQEDYVSETSKCERKGEEGGGVLMENKMNGGIDIGGQREDVLEPAFDRSSHSSDVNFEKMTESGTSNDLGVCTNIQGLEQEMCEWMHGNGKNEGYKKGGNVKKLNAGQKSRNSRLEKVIPDFNAYGSIEGLKGKIYGLMHEERKSKETLIEYGQLDNVEGVEQRMTALMHETKECDEEVKALKASKAQTIGIATKLSLKLVDFMFSMSEWKEMLVKFQEAKYLLEWVIEDENSLVLNMIISTMELVDKEVRRMKEIEEVKTESLERSSVNMEEMEQKGRFDIESKVDQFIDDFIKQVLRLEFIMKHFCHSSFISESDESEINEIWKRPVDLKIKEWIGGGRARE